MLPQQIEELKQKIEGLEKKIKKLENKSSYSLKLFFKKRRLLKLREKLKKLETDNKNGVVRICFGTKKLFNAQFHLEKSGFKSFDEWKEAWEQARNNNFFFLGSKDETAGNQTCTAIVQKDGKLTLRIRVPDALISQYGKYIAIADISFNYGQNAILAALGDCTIRNALQRLKNPAYKNRGQALSYRFAKDKKGWRIFVSTTLSEPEWLTTPKTGVIGVDINIDHLAVVESDHNGNPITKYTIPLDLHGKNTDQRLAEIGNACAEVVKIATETKKDIAIEELNFQQKKAELGQINNTKYRRMLSSFAYQTIIRTIKSRAFRFGVHIHEVNPAYTSLLGRIKFAKRYGLSIHQAAALCIGRRFLGFSERPPRHLNDIPDGKDGHVTLPLPVRNRSKHVWSFLREVNRNLQAVLAAHFRTVLNRSTDPPLRPVRQI